MSTVLHQREMHIAITAEESGRELANAPHDLQAAFFNAMTDEIEQRALCPRPFGSSAKRPNESWGDTCRMIADELHPVGRERIASYLESLIERLREVRECSTCEGAGTVTVSNKVQVDVGPPGKNWPLTVAHETFQDECPKCNGTKVE